MIEGQMALFDIRSERDRILESLSSNHSTYLEFVRAIAREIAIRTGSVSIDEVREELSARNLPMPNDIGCDERVFGALFRSKQWNSVGQRPSTRAERISRSGIGASYVTVYRFQEKAA